MYNKIKVYEQYHCLQDLIPQLSHKKNLGVWERPIPPLLKSFIVREIHIIGYL